MKASIKGELQRSNPYGWKHCNRNDCITCNLDIQINCRTRGNVYEMECVQCRETVSKKYRGQSGRSIYEQMKEHILNWQQKDEESYLHKHSLDCDGGGIFDIDVKLMAKCFGRPTERMITESVKIEELSDENTMNSKSEWTYVRLPRIVVS